MNKVIDRRSWVEIDLSQLKTNLEIYKENQSSKREIMAVVKADAYGHGDKIVSKFLFDNGIHYFAVSNIDEAKHIRDAGVGGHVLILGYTPIERLNEVVEYNISQTLLSEDYADLVVSSGLPVKCQFALDTGMRRIGLNCDDIDRCENSIRKYSEELDLEGLFTHLCVADTPEQDSFTDRQISLFEEVCKRVVDLNLPYCHCMNSAGGLWHDTNLSFFSRLGIILYGLKPDYVNFLPVGINPVLSWKSVVSMVKIVNPGDTIGYGRTFTVDQPMRIATIPTGYADGYNRLLSNKGFVLISSKKAPIVGRVCMDQMMVDVTDISNVHIGTEVTLIGNDGNERITADDIAKIYDSIGYEVVCGINKRVARVYK